MEFALVGPAVLLAVLFIIEAGWQLATEMALQNGASDAVRFAMTGQSEIPDTSGSPSCRAASIVWITVHAAPAILSSSRLNVTSSANGGAQTGSGASGFGGLKSQTITYVFSYSQNYLTPLGAAIMGASSMKHRVLMLAENEPYPTSGC